MKKIISLFLVLTLTLSMSIPALAAGEQNTGYISTNNVSVLSENDYSVSFEITYVWTDCYAATITVTNQSEQAIENWELGFELGSNITKIENAMITEVAGDNYLLTPKPYSRVIPTNATVQIGVLIAGSVDTIPSDFCLSGTYLNATSADITLVGRDLYQGDGEFYVINDKIFSLTGALAGFENISNCVYIIEDEYGNILSEGTAISNEKIEIDNIGFGIGYNRVTIVGKSGSGLVYTSFDVVNFNMENVRQLGIDIETDTDNDGICNYLENAIGTDPYNATSIDRDKTDYESVLSVIGLDPNESSIGELEDTIELGDNDISVEQAW